MAGALLGDQALGQISINNTGGYLVWQDNGIDGNGLGVAALRLDASLSGAFAHFRVNQQAAGDQERPQIALLQGGGAAIVWQGGREGFQKIFVRCIGANGAFTTGADVQVNVYTNQQQITPVIATLANGNVVIAWSSYEEDGSFQGVFARVLDRDAQFVSAPFQVNQFWAYNQRNPAIAALAGGGFVVAWVSEQQRSVVTEGSRFASVDVYARLFAATGAPVGNEFLVNTALSNICANPAVSGTASGGFTAVWSQQDQERTNGWEVVGRNFQVGAVPAGASFAINTYRYGDQFGPKLSTLGANQMAVWTSIGQDGSFHGVFGRAIGESGPVGDEFQINTTTVNRQLYPAVAADGLNRFLVVWSGFVATYGLDLYAQRYSFSQALPVPSPPFVSALSQSRLSVTWPLLQGYALDHYEVFMDDSLAASTISNLCTVTGLAAASTHSFRLKYVLEGNQHSPLSDPATGTTWGEDANGDGLPDDWQVQYWGSKEEEWGSGGADSDGDGASNFREFQAGTDPRDAGSVLRTRIRRTAQGNRIEWNTQPGLIYQVSFSTALSSWTNIGLPRFAAGTTDSMPIQAGPASGFYRVTRLR